MTKTEKEGKTKGNVCVWNKKGEFKNICAYIAAAHMPQMAKQQAQ